jgi:non-specific serine/threonine protein kinase
MAEREAGAGAEVAGFGAVLRRHRVAAGLTQEALAERAGLSRRGVQHLEAGDARPYPTTLDALAAALALAPEDRARLRAAARAGAAPLVGPADGRRGRRPPPAGPSNLPLQLTSFVGRERALAATRELLAAHRLVTLTGAGGVGKTRLALEAAGALRPAYPDGVWLAELAALADPALVAHAVAAATGVREQPGRPLAATLADALRDKRLLLVLDNCEHLVEACARLAEALLRACPALTVLATSREALGVAGEAPWRVPSLTLPPLPDDGPAPAAALAGVEAVLLFAARAAAARPGFAVTDDNAGAVARLCVRLDGVPLALELAAARVRVLPVEQLLGRLEDRFAVLTGGSRTALPRQQTLRATVDWSYDLLDGDERTLFARLSVFAGGFALEAAEAVGADPDGAGPAAGAVLDLLTRLADKSLVVADEQPGGAARYRLLETLRQYAQERLEASGEATAVGRRHAAYFLVLATATASDPAGFDRLEQEHDNLRAALRWCLGHGRRAQALRFGAALWPLWAIRGHATEGRARLAELLTLPEAERPTRVSAAAYRGAARLALNQGDLAAARALYEQSLARWRAVGDAAGVAGTLVGLGDVARARGDGAAARSLLTQGLAAGRAAGARDVVAAAHYYLGLFALQEGDYAAARRHLTEALRGRREAGAEFESILCRIRLGHVAHAEGDPAGARALYEQSLAALGERTDKRVVADLVINLALVEVDAADHAAARAHLEQAAGLVREVQDPAGAALCLDGFAGLAGAQGQPEQALRLAGAAARRREALGASHPRNLRAWLERQLAPARAALDADRAAAAWTAGQGLPLEQALAEALEEHTHPA